MTDAHLVIERECDGDLDLRGATDLVAAYRTTRTALNRASGCDGFAISFAINWTPYGDGIGEPDEHGNGIHVFGRRAAEPTTLVRRMAVPRLMRAPAQQDAASLDDALREVVRSGTDPFLVPPVPVRSECDGCAESVRVDQELWRDGTSRVIRPWQPVIGANVLVLPLRHVASLGDLAGEEVISIVDQLRLVLDRFDSRFGSTGLSCFANDGVRSRQETPHVHIHTFGRLRDEPEQPFEVLLRRIGIAIG